MKAEQGMVKTQAKTMRSPQIHRTDRTPCVVPTPRMAPVMAWVVEMGIPPMIAPQIVAAAETSAQNPPTGCSRVIPEPTVLTIRQPPNIVPSAMAAWQERIIHGAMLCWWPNQLP